MADRLTGCLAGLLLDPDHLPKVASFPRFYLQAWALASSISPALDFFIGLPHHVTQQKHNVPVHDNACPCSGTDAPWRRDSAAAAAVAANGAPPPPPQPQPPQPATEWPDAHGELVTSEDGGEKQPTYKAFAFNDAERADLAAAGGIGMLGYRFHRRTSVNW